MSKFKPGHQHFARVTWIEYREGGNTLWVHGAKGGTVLRIKITGGITTKECESAPEPHLDLIVDKPAVMCLPKKREPGPEQEHTRLENQIAKAVGPLNVRQPRKRWIGKATGARNVRRRR